MSDDDVKRKPIDPPHRDQRKNTARAVVEAIAQATPVSAGLARLYQTTHPSDAERNRGQWENSITERSNEHDERLDVHERAISPHTETIDGTAARLLEVLGRDCADGMRSKRYALDDLCELLPEESQTDIESAVFELNSMRLLEVNRNIKDFRVRLGEEFYKQIDRQIMGWDTENDAAMLAEAMINDRTLESMPRLQEHIGWEKRRFNPALSRVMEFIPAGRTRQVKTPDYATLGFVLLPEDRSNLRRFIREINQRA